MRLGVLTGLGLEAGRFAAASPDIEITSGAGPRAGAAARRLIDSGVEALLGFGLAGALSAELDTGSVVVAATVRSPEGGELAADGAWCARLRQQIAVLGCEVRSGALHGAHQVIVDPAQKRTLAESGALAVDTESHHMAALAAAAGLPFAVVRVVVDRAGDRLPGFVGESYDAEGRLRPGAVLGGLLRRPGELPALLRLAARSRRALVVLGGVGRLGAGLGPV